MENSLYLYVQVQVQPADSDRATLLNGLVEKVTGTPQLDLIPHTDPGAISFSSVLVEAASDDEAYDTGYIKLKASGHKRGQNAVMNDYVVNLTKLGLITEA
jgi:hypothetical protein